MSYVNIIKLKRDTYGEIENSIKMLVNIQDFLDIDDGDSVIIKINLCFFRDFRTGATTDPRVLQALLKLLQLKFHNLKIYIVESDATATFADLLFKWLNITQIAQKYNAKVINLSNESYSTERVSKSLKLKNINIPEIMDQDAFFISLAKMKTHSLTKISGILKNQFGCFPKKNKARFHPYLDEIIADLNLIFKPDLSIIDGIIAMEGNDGPIWGTPRLQNILISSKDPVAADSLMAKLMGFHSAKIKHLKLSSKLGIGTLNYKLDSDLSELIQKFKYNKSEEYYFKGVNLFKDKILA